ncbi:MAG: SH3 domain-containing C40 family peptidase [Eubacteriales bacterium]|nr:SH3 domain-containing C40 family peptidase [Eubacteriales bacterium]
MRKRNVGIVAGCLLTTVVLGVGTASAQNTKTDKLSVNIPSAGIAVALENYNVESNKKAELSALITDKVAAAEETTKVEETTTQEETTTEAPTQEETTTEAPKETSVYDTIAMSQVEDYVNVRTAPSTDADIVGKIYNNCAATIVGTEGDWYKIESGNCTGYIKKDYFVTGEEAKAIAVNCGYVNATVTTETLNVREGQQADGRILTQLPEGGQYDVIQYGDGWVYLNIDEDVKGWVSMDYVNIDVKFNTAITLEEEEAKLAEEARLAEEAKEAERKAGEAKAAEEARRKAAASKNTSSSSSSNTSSSSSSSNTQISDSVDTSSASALRAAVVAYALQFEGNPYVYGGSSLTNGTDCSGFTMAVYNYFGYSLPHQSGSQSGCGTRVSLDSLLPGDLLFYTNGGSSIGHVALYIGNGQIIHASTPSTGIKISSANYRTPLCAVRIIN